MIDERRVREMACEYNTNHSTARKLLESARDVPALRIGRRYQIMLCGAAFVKGLLDGMRYAESKRDSGGDAGGREKGERGKEGISDAVPGCGQIGESDR